MGKRKRKNDEPRQRGCIGVISTLIRYTVIFIVVFSGMSLLIRGPANPSANVSQTNAAGLTRTVAVLLVTARASQTSAASDRPAAATVTPTQRQPTESVRSAALPMATITPSPTNPPTNTPTNTPSRTPTNTRIAATLNASPTAASVASLSSITYYVTANTNVRSCAATICAQIGRLAAGETFIALEIVDGERVTGSNSKWYRFSLNGQDGYVYSGLAQQQNAQAPARAQAQPPTRSSGGAGGSGSGSSAAAPPPTSAPAAPASSWVCFGDRYNCDDFSNRAELMSYWNACPGDPSRLDRDNDGIPCESLR